MPYTGSENSLHGLVILKGWLLLVFLFLHLSSVNGRNIDSTKVIEMLNNYQLKTNKGLKDFLNLVRKNENTLTTKQRKKYLHQGFYQAKDQQRDTLVFKFAEYLGDIFEYNAQSKTDLDSSIYFYQIYLDIALKFKSNALIADAYNSIGAPYHLNGNLEKALTSFTNSIEYYKKSDEPEGRVYPLSNLSNIYSVYGDIETSIKYTKEGLELSQLLSPIEKTYNALYKCSDLIFQYDELEKSDSAFYYLQQGEKAITTDSIPETARFQGVLFNFHQACIIHFLKKGDAKNAKKYHDKILKNQYIGSGYGILLRIRYELESGNIEAAGNLINNAPEFIRDTSSVHGLEYIHHRSEYFEKIGEFEKAIIDFKMVKELEERRENDKAFEYANYLKYKLDLNKKEHQIKLLEKDNKLKSSQAMSFGIGAIGILLASSFFIFQYFQLRKKNNQLKKQGELIERQSKTIHEEAILKENLFENISHELRTPLTLISSPINYLLNKGSRNIEDRKNLELISNYSNQLLNLTNQVLDITKSKFNQIKVNVFSFHLDNLLDYLKNEFELKASKQNIELVFINDSKIDTLLLTDAEKLITILKNLILNAIKYSKETGTITITSHLENETLKVRVNDTGQGITEEALPYIFDRYYQSSEMKTMLGGVGLGLAICKNYIHLLGGKIEVVSTKEIGSTFSIEVPLKHSNALDSVQPFEFPKVYLPKPNILPKLQDDFLPNDYLLIVEDNIDLCHHINDVLKKDYLMSFAQDGNEALNQIKRKIPKIIITDWMMPGMDGEELISNLKSNELYTSIPILMLTARNQPVDRLSILRVGVDDYLTKPFIPDSLKAHVNRLDELASSRIFEEPEYKIPKLSKVDTELLQKLEKVIFKNIANFDFSLSDISDDLKISPRQLNRKVKSLTGLTPKQYVNEIRYQEAKRMLETREYSTVKAIIYSVGFKSEQNFSRNFKKRFGKYPKEILY